MKFKEDAKLSIGISYINTEVWISGFSHNYLIINCFLNTLHTYTYVPVARMLKNIFVSYVRKFREIVLAMHHKQNSYVNIFKNDAHIIILKYI